MTFETLVKRYRKEEPVASRILGVDPGNETGNCLFVNGTLDAGWQTPTAPNGTIDFEQVEEMFDSANPDIVVCENFRLYQHKMKEQSFSEIPTLRLIGAIMYICWKRNIPLYFQMAVQAKGFCTDVKLKEWGFWQKGQRHSRDAIRHVCYWILFHK